MTDERNKWSKHELALLAASHLVKELPVSALENHHAAEPEPWVLDLIARAEQTWKHRSSPAPLVQSIQEHLGSASDDEKCMALAAVLKLGAVSPEAQAMVTGGICAEFTTIVAADPALGPALEGAYQVWPRTAQILYTIRLLRSPLAIGAPITDLLGSIGALIEACSHSERPEDVPFEMSLGFLQAVNSSDLLPQKQRDAALLGADALLLMRREVCPSVLSRILHRHSERIHEISALARTRRIVESSNIVDSLTNPLLVHVAILILFEETNLDVREVYATLRGIAEESKQWTPGCQLEISFNEAAEATSDGMFCREFIGAPASTRF